jgi:hypothetical protein
MRPLHAHCYLGIGTLYAKSGQREKGRAELLATIELHRAMEMTFWLPQAEAALAQVHQGMVAVLATGQTLTQPLCLVLRAKAAGYVGQIEEALRLLAETLIAGRGKWAGATCLRRRIGSRESCYCSRPPQMQPKRPPVSSRPWRLPAGSRPNPRSCAPR